MFSLLYVDDEPGLLELGKLFLEQQGTFSVDTVESGPAALESIARKEYDAIVSDFQMPVMNGIELLKRIRAAGNTVPFVIFTGRGREEVVIQALNEGADFYLQKGGDPVVQFTELAHKVQKAIMQKRTEASVRDHERREADIINFLPDATFAIDTGGRVIAWNQAMEKMTGVAAADILGKGDYEYALPFYHERRPILINLVLDNDPATAARYPLVKREGRNLYSEITIPHFNQGKGAVLWFTASLLYNTRGQVVGAIESIREITERRQAEEALNESERRFRELADLLPQGVYEADTSGRMTYANRVALEMSGYTEQDLQNGLNALGVIAPADRERAAAVFSLMTERGVRMEGEAEYRAVRKDGSTFPVSIFSSPVIRDGRIAGVRGVIMDMTARKKAEEELQAANEQLVASDEELRAQYDELATSEKQLRLLKISADRSSDQIFWLDFDGNILYANDAACSDYGYSREEFSKIKIFGLNPDLTKEIWALSVADLRERKNQLITSRHRRRDGSIMDVEIVAVYVNQEDREFSFAYVRDITDRKQAENELKAAYEQVAATEEELREQYDNLAAAHDEINSRQQQLEEITSMVPGVVYQFYAKPDGSRGMYYLSARADAMLGLEPGLDTFFPAFTSCVHEDDRARFLSSVDDAVKRKADWHFEGRFCRPSGECFWFEGISSPVTRGNELVYTGVILDITTRKRAEAALEDSERKYRMLFETAEEGIWTIDAEFRTVSANRKLQEIFGYTEQEMAGRPVWDFVHPDDVESMRRELLGRPRGVPGRYERRWVRKDGTEIWCLTSATPVFAKDGIFTGSFGMFTDITERRRSEAAIREANRKLNLLSSITRHDIRNQLVIAQGFAQLAKRNSPGAATEEFLNKIAASLAVIEHQIDFTKTYQDLAVHEPAWFSIHGIVDRARPATVELHCTCTDVEIYADPMIDRVFFNLFDNTIKYGGESPEVTVACTEQEGCLILTFADTGAGIPSGEKVKIFTKGYGKNTGLGLFLAREILAITGITIEETGTEGKGAVFSIAVPKGGFRYRHAGS